jgi:biotin operon repressor
MPYDDNGNELVSLSEAAAMLGVSRVKVWRLVKAGDLVVAGVDVLDKRSKLVKRSDVEALQRRTAKKAAA